MKKVIVFERVVLTVMSVLLALLIIGIVSCRIGVAYCSISREIETSRYDEGWIIGRTDAEIAERYGQFYEHDNLVSIDNNLKTYYFADPHLDSFLIGKTIGPFYYGIYFNGDGIAQEVHINTIEQLQNRQSFMWQDGYIDNFHLLSVLGAIALGILVAVFGLLCLVYSSIKKLLTKTQTANWTSIPHPLFTNKGGFVKKAIICINIAILIVALSIGVLYIHAEGLRSRFDESLIIGQTHDSIVDKYGTDYYAYNKSAHEDIKDPQPRVISYLLCKQRATSLLDYVLTGDNYRYQRNDLYYQIRFDEAGIAYDTCIVSEPLNSSTDKDHTLWQYLVIYRLLLYIALLVGVEVILITVNIIRSKKAKKPAETPTAETN